MPAKKIKTAEIATLALLAEFPSLSKDKVRELKEHLEPDALEIAEVLLGEAAGSEEAQRMAEAIRKWAKLLHSPNSEGDSTSTDSPRQVTAKRLVRVQ